MTSRHITRITAENFMRLKAVDISPDGNIVYITGANGEGKSSVLNAICAALNWRDAAGSIPEPIHKGEKKAIVTVDLGDMAVTRTWTPSGTQLKVESKDGASYKSPQAMLDKFFSQIGFDPLEFIRMQPKDQRQTLMDLLGIDFSKLDEERTQLLQQKGPILSQVNTLETQLNEYPDIPDYTPDTEVSVSDIIQEIQAAHARISEYEQSRIFHSQELEELCEVERQIQHLETRWSELNGSIKARVKFHAEFVRPDVSHLQDQLNNIETINRAVRAKTQKTEIERKWRNSRSELSRILTDIDTIDLNRRDVLQAAQFPVSGLTFDESGVLFQGVPLKQASSAEQIRVSLAIGIAMNPSLKFLIIRDGSLMDSKSRALVADMAAEHNMQVFIEAVDESGSMGFVIENGEVRAPVEPGQQVLA